MTKISVSSLVLYLKNKLDNDDKLQGVVVSGEISNFHRHNSGHLYFTLKDERSAISCVMFSSKAKLIKFEPKNGDKVVLSANTSIFETSGQLQLYVNSLKLDGLGDLYQQYEELKNRLASEGYFDQDNKQDLSFKYPENIAVLVGDKSAAMSDIKTQFLRRWPLSNVDYYPVLVQGSDASNEIIERLLEVDEKGYDAIILARGGGSFEDLFCFNDEKLVKTIYSLETFIITGIGHEQDFTLVDFVADLRAPTPTACVELITPNMNDVIKEIDNYTLKINKTINNKYENNKKDVETLVNNKYLLNPMLLVDNKMLKLDYYEQKLIRFNEIINSINISINNNLEKMRKNIENKFRLKKLVIDKFDSLLNAYSVNNTLKRGFSIVYKEDKIVNSTKDLYKKDKVKIKLYDGHKNAIIEE